MERQMLYGASHDLFEKAKKLRENMTTAEKILWQRLKQNQLGVRFKPQHTIDIFIVDFYCHQLKLIIELDGEIHNFQKEKDIGRNNELKNNDIIIIRFTNKEVLDDIEKVISSIKEKIQGLQSH